MNQKDLREDLIFSKWINWFYICLFMNSYNNFYLKNLYNYKDRNVSYTFSDKGWGVSLLDLEVNFSNV